MMNQGTRLARFIRLAEGAPAANSPWETGCGARRDAILALEERHWPVGEDRLLLVGATPFEDPR